MNSTSFELRFSEFELANALADAKPPDGVKISVSQPIIQASHGADIIVRVVFDFSMSVKVNVPSVVLLGLAGWIAKQLRAKVKGRKKKKTKINRNIIPLNKRDILLLIKEDISAQIQRDAQWREHQANKETNRDKSV